MVCKYPNEARTTRVWRALKSGRQLRLDVNGWCVDAQTGELIGPAPVIELLGRNDQSGNWYRPDGRERPTQ
jgi:hypothetical protein